MNSWVRRQERTVRGKGAERQTKGEDEGKRSEKRWRGGEGTTKRSAGYAESMCVRESTATFPHILSPWRQRARVQSAPIYRGGKAAAAYLVEYLPLSTRGRCTYRVVTLWCQQHREGVHARVRARVRARSVLSKSLGAFLDSASLGLTWRGLAWRYFDRSPLFRRHTALRTCYEKCRRNCIYGDSFSDSWNIILWTSLNLWILFFSYER